MDNINHITTKLAGSDFLNCDKFSNLEDLEAFTTQKVRNILQEWLESSEDSLPKPQTRCRECGNFANYVSKRVGFIQSRFGLLRYKRAYYVCPHCHQSTCPLDERLDPIESLSRLRSKLADGKSLLVAEIAKDWGLGSLQVVPSITSNEIIPENASAGIIEPNQEPDPYGSHLWGAA